VAEPKWLVAIAASAGGVEALQTFFRGLGTTHDASIVVVLHRTPSHESHLESIIRRCTRMPVVQADDGERVAPGVVYVARPDLHLTVTAGRHFAYRDGRRIKFLRSSAVPLLDSAAAAFGDRVVAVVLTGSGTDATDGVQRVKQAGGVVIAQDQATSEYWSMPSAAITSGAVDLVLPLSEIAPAVRNIVAPVEGSAQPV
jgi:two-component system chemotaxis response regulator CheB